MKPKNLLILAAACLLLFAIIAFEVRLTTADARRLSEGAGASIAEPSLSLPVLDAD